MSPSQTLAAGRLAEAGLRRCDEERTPDCSLNCRLSSSYNEEGLSFLEMAQFKAATPKFVLEDIAFTFKTIYASRPAIMPPTMSAVRMDLGTGSFEGFCASDEIPRLKLFPREKVTVVVTLGTSVEDEVFPGFDTITLCIFSQTEGVAFSRIFLPQGKFLAVIAAHSRSDTAHH